MNRRCMKILLKNLSLKIMSALVLLYFGKEIFVLIRDGLSYPNYPLSQTVHHLYSLALVSFAVIAVVSLILSNKIKHLMGDALMIAHKSDVFNRLFHFAVLCCLIVTGVIVFVQLGLFIAFGKGNYTYLLRVTIDALFFFGLVGMIAFFVGALLSKLKNEIVQFIVFAVIILFMSDVKNDYFPSGGLFTAAYTIIQIMPMDTEVLAEYSHGIHLGLWQGSIILAWSFILFAFNIMEKRKAVRSVAFFIAGILFFAFSILYGFEPRQYSYNYRNDDWYMSSGCEEKSNKEIMEELLYYVTDYKLDITIGEKLKATATMTLSKTDCDEYSFALVHGYKIKEVKSGSGDKIDFVQKGDNFTVVGTGDLSEVTVEYEGKVPVYFSDFESTLLPAGSAWYPYPGKQIFYGTSLVGELKSTSEMAVYNREANYSVTINAPYEVHANLTKRGKNDYSGRTDSLMLIGGPGYKCVERNGITYVYFGELEYSPKLPDGIDSWFDEIENEIDEENIFFDGDAYVFQGLHVRSILNHDFGRKYVGSNLVMYNLDGVYRK